jgi:Tol biopolymer transport system component
VSTALSDGSGNDSAGLWIVPLSAGGAGEPEPILEEVTSWLLLEAVWSPDGQRLAYVNQGDVWLYDLATGNATQLTDINRTPLPGPTADYDEVTHIHWSPEGSKLALELTGNFPSPYSGLAVVDVDTGKKSFLVDSAQLFGWTPDGSQISFLIAFGDTHQTYTYDQYLINPETGEIENLTKSNSAYDPFFDPPEAHQPSAYQTGVLTWSSMGSYLYETLSFFPEQEEPIRGLIVRSDPETIVAEHLGNMDGAFMYPAWLGDGRYTYVKTSAQPVKDWDTFLMERVLIEETPVLEAAEFIRGAAWSPDGSYLALVLNRENQLEDQLVSDL